MDYAKNIAIHFKVVPILNYKCWVIKDTYIAILLTIL